MMPSLRSEIAAEASARHGRVLVGRCHEAEQILPLGPWVDVLRAASLSPVDDAVTPIGDCCGSVGTSRPCAGGPLSRGRTNLAAWPVGRRTPRGELEPRG